MPRVVAFLRAINVGGHTVQMTRPRGLFEALGLKDVETFIASGNVVFTTSSGNLDALQRKIEAHLEKALGYEVKTFLRTEAEVTAIARHRPFPAAAVRNAAALYVAFVDAPLGVAERKLIAAMKTDIDDFHVGAREIYWLCRKRQSESTFSYARLEKQIKGPATFRGVRTVEKLAAKYCRDDS